MNSNRLPKGSTSGRDAPFGLGWILVSEMEFHVVPAEPAPASCGEMSGLWDLLEAEHFAVEGRRIAFSTGRHRQLDVVEPEEGHRGAQGISATDRALTW
jgi:hypothetical protein